MMNHSVGPAVFDGQVKRGKMPRQRPVRELLRDARVRVARSRPLPHAGRRAPRHLRLHRRLVQSAAATFGARLSLAHDLRALARDQRSHRALRIDDRHRGCYLGTPVGEGAVTISKAVHRPPNRGNSTHVLRPADSEVACGLDLLWWPIIWGIGEPSVWMRTTSYLSSQRSSGSSARGCFHWSSTKVTSFLMLSSRIDPASMMLASVFTANRASDEG